jgi:hypothetical protein
MRTYNVSRTAYHVLTIAVIALFAIGCGDETTYGDTITNNYAAPSASVPQPAPDANVETDAQAEATVDAGNDVEVDSGHKIQLSISFTGPTEQTLVGGAKEATLLETSFCVDNTEDLIAKTLEYELGNETGNLLDPQGIPYFNNLKVMIGDTTVMGPVELSGGTTWPSQNLTFGDEIYMYRGICSDIRLVADVAEGISDFCSGCTYHATLRIPTNGNGLVVGATSSLPLQIDQISPQVDINGNVMTVASKPVNDAYYCEPLSANPDVFGYDGCCGTFTKADSVKTGDLIKGSLPPIYYVGSDGNRARFPSSIELDSWFAPLDSMSVPVHNYHAICLEVLEVTDAQLAAIPIGGTVTKRPGAYITGILTDPKRYVVDTHHLLRWVQPQILEQIYPGTVTQRTYLTPDAILPSYTMGSDITSADQYIWLQKYPGADIEVELGIHP